MQDAQMVQERVQAWVKRLGWEHEEVQPSEVHDWGFRVTNDQDDRLVLGWYELLGVLHVQCTMQLPRSSQMAFRMMSSRSKLAFLADLAILFHTNFLEYRLETKDEETVEVSDDDLPNLPCPYQATVLGTLFVDDATSIADFFHACRVSASIGNVVFHMFSKMSAVRRWG